MGPVALVEGFGEAEDAVVFGDIVAYAAGYGAGELRGKELVSFEGDVAEGGPVCGGQLVNEAETFFTFEAAAIVVAGAEFAGFVCVDNDDDGFVGIEGYCFVVEGVAVEFESGIFEAEGGCELIHDAAADAYPVAVFGGLGEEGDFIWCEAGAGDMVKECGGADFIGGGGAEAGPEGDVALNDDVVRGSLMASLLELIEDGKEVAAPGGL